MAKLTAISAEQAESVLEEFHHIANAGDYVARGGIDYARKLLMRAFEPDQAKRLLDRLTKALGADAASFDAIQKADPQQLAKFIHNEHPQTIALVLSHLNYSQAAALLTSLPANMRADISQRMASLDQISPDIILKIAAVIGSKLKALGEFSRESTAEYAPWRRCSIVWILLPAARSSTTSTSRTPTWRRPSGTDVRL